MDREVSPASRGKGYIFVISAAFLWAVSGSSAKFLFNSGISPHQLVQLRLTIAASLLFLWLLIRKPRHLVISGGDIIYFIVFGVIGMASVQFTYLFAISKINVAAAILLQYLAPAFIAVYAILFQGDKFRRNTIVALIGAIFGCYLVVGAYSLNLFSLNMAGIISGLLSALGFAWYSIHGEYGMRKYEPWTVLFYALFFAALTWNMLHPPFAAFTGGYSKVEWGFIVYIGLMGTLLPFGLYLEGINLIRSTHASITATLEPIAAGVISYLFLNETMDGLQIAGAILVLGSIILLQSDRRQDDKTPDVMRSGKTISALTMPEWHDEIKK